MLKVVCVIMAHNAARTLPAVLNHLKKNNFLAAVVDHGSTDATSEILDRFESDPIIFRSFEPFDGVFRLSQQLEIKRRIIAQIDADWIIHLDADEILESPRAGESLRSFITRLDAEGAATIECDEFVFAPENDAADYEGRDFVAEMTRYYHFAPEKRRLQRAFKCGIDTSYWDRSGGHQVTQDASSQPERMRMRHYIGLSVAHLREQYLGRVFCGEELSRGWHCNRVPVAMDFVRAPDPSKLLDVRVDGWRTDRPEPRHLVFSSSVDYTPPTLSSSTEERPPAPFIVGTGRSGTTLLRLLMDRHSAFAIPPETHWLSAVIRTARANHDDPRAAVRATLEKSHNWVDMGFTPAQFEHLIDSFDPSDLTGFLRTIYARYAQREGAARFGDKTPIHLLCMTEIAQALPEARFVHVIRDGRDVATSHRKLWFGPGEDMNEAATMWMWRIARARQQAQFLPHYMEIRYEDLVSDTRATLEKVCAFVGVEFEEAQLTAYRRAPERLKELGPLNAGGRVLSAEQRQSIHALTARPPDPSRIGRFRDDLTTDQINQFERVAGGFLKDLGYAPTVSA